MKKILFILVIIIINFKSLSQSPLYYDYIETYNWLGGWSVGFGSENNFFNNNSVSPNFSAATIGKGTSGSVVEEGYYLLPNVTLNTNNTYNFSFRLGAYRTFNPTATTAGNDIADYITVMISTNGGSTWTSEIRVTGFSGAFWNYNTNAFILKTANGFMNTYTPAGGGNRTSTGDGYSTIILDIPPGTSQLSVRIQSRVNSAGEEWWFDNFELSQNISLPVELIEFTAEKEKTSNILKWSTASEYNSSHFILQKSTTGIFESNSDIANIQAAGNSNQVLEYRFVDTEIEESINYYRLIQYDNDGKFKEYDIIAVDNRSEKRVIRTIDNLGRDIDQYYRGFYYIIYSDGSIERNFKN